MKLTIDLGHILLPVVNVVNIVDENSLRRAYREPQLFSMAILTIKVIILSEYCIHSAGSSGLKPMGMRRVGDVD